MSSLVLLFHLMATVLQEIAKSSPVQIVNQCPPWGLVLHIYSLGSASMFLAKSQL
jgi:hypothetical protein